MSQTREEELEMTVAEYRKQLSTVIAAINTDFDGSNSEELRALKTSLEEVIAFTEVELISVKKQTLLDRLNNCGDSDDVYCVYDGHNGSQFIDHSKGDAKQSTSSSSHSFNDNNKKEEVDGDSDDKELMDSIRAMSGSKCMAPYVEQNGTVRYHNAIIMVTDAELSATTSDCDISVKVLFTNPICQSMKPCAHYMSGKCRYSDDKCRYSHGHRVSFASIKPYEEVNHSSLTIDSICLVKCAEDELWYKAVIDQYLEDTQQFVVKYLNSKIVDTVDIEHLLPLITNNTESDTSDDSSSSDDSGEENQQQEVKPCVATFPLRRRSASALGEWEMHTKGIGSKLMRKMGYVLGEGLGKNGEGRTNPIEVTVFPAGKSLDMCMRIKERRAGKDPNKETRRQRARKAKIACGYNRVIKSNKSSDSVFDFINNKVAKSGAKCDNNDNKDEASNRHVLSLSKLKSTDNQSLNVLSLKIAEDKRKAESELCRLQCSIETRKSKSRERESVAHLESQVVKQRNAIKSLCDQECAIQRELKLRSNNKKLQVF